ncbi:hypothetical protein [uncultured Clostridium sp.]|uniref:hypothetical protein n=1 Tax=uncultured Clostridium sp. TaxID=59620 RepID=UPI00260C0200|nr:hypothetical protein [uncultured Clostridium sp.]
MQKYLSPILFLAFAIYFIVIFKKNFNKRKALYTQGDYVEFTHFLPSFYTYIVCAIIFLLYLVYARNHLNAFEIITGILFAIAIAFSATLSSKVTLGNKGIFLMSYYLEYDNINAIGIQKLNENKFAIGFIKNNKIVFSLKLNRKNKDTLKEFISKRNVFIQDM